MQQRKNGKYQVRKGHNNFLSDAERRQMIMEHIKLPEMIARARLGIKRSNLKYEDVVSEGYAGMLQAADRYDPKRGPFSNYAFYWVLSAQQRFLYHDFSVVPLGWSGEEQNAFYCLLRVQKGRTQIPFDAPLEQIAREEGLPKERLARVRQRMDAYDRSIDEAAALEREPRWYRGLRSPEETAEERAMALSQDKKIEFMKMFFERHHALLTEEERWVIKTRYFSGTEKPTHFEVIGDWMRDENNPQRRNGVTKQRVEQIEKSAIRKLREAALEYDCI